MENKHVNKNTILSELMKSPHGELSEYLTVGRQASIDEPEFLSHLLSYNREKGEIRDSKVALPVIALTNKQLDKEYRENALAHLALLVPRELLRALKFGIKLQKDGVGVRINDIYAVVKSYLRAKEANHATWSKMVVQHRDSIKTLYSLAKAKPSPIAKQILFENKYPAGSVFEDIANLYKMSTEEAARIVVERRLPFLVARGALKEKIKNPDLLLALIGRMSAAEVLNNSKMLEQYGVRNTPALRAAYEEALVKATGSKKVGSFKANKAAESVEDEAIKAKLHNVQENKIKQLAGPDGNWAVLADKSGSMSGAIELARMVAGTLAKTVKGNVYLVFFDVAPRVVEVTGKTYEQILASTKSITAGGGTSIGCALLSLLDRKVEIDGIAVVSDGGENQPPMFATVYKNYSKFADKEVPVYLYKTSGETDSFSRSCKAADIDVQLFDFTSGKVDHYGLSAVISSMRTNRYSILDAIMDSRLLTVEDVLGAEKALTAV